MSAIANTKEALAAAKTRMEKAVEDFRKELGTLRTGRANASLLDSIRVDYHGSPMPVNQLGSADGAGAQHDRHRSVGSQRSALDRQSDPHLRPGP